MSVDSLKKLYLHELKDLYSADKQAKASIEKMAEKADHKKLSEALTSSAKGCQSGMDAIAAVCEAHGEKPTGKHCKGMEGLVNEAEAHVFKEDFSEPEIRDAAIIAQAQRMTHYAIAGYGTARAFAKQVDCEMGVSKMTECLDATYEGDRTMTDLAEGGVNKSAEKAG